MHIAIGNDHRGCNLKETVIKVVMEAGHTFHDFGCYTEDAVDYPDIAVQVAEGIVKGKFDRGILICGTGIGMCIAANKVRGIRAAQAYNAFSAQRARRHNNANILCLAAEEGRGLVPAILEKFLTTEFEGGRHQQRLDKISNMEGG